MNMTRVQIKGNWTVAGQWGISQIPLRQPDEMTQRSPDRGEKS
jgi:hypothetical protein